MKHLTLIAAVLFVLVACKKQIETTEKVNPQTYFFKIVEVDKDGTEHPTPVFYAKMEPLVTGGGNTPYPLGWESWLEWVKKLWCENSAHFNNTWYCTICPQYSACIATPVKWVSYGINDKTIYWETTDEVNVNVFRIDYSKDGKTFKPLAYHFPIGGGYYSYTIN